MARFGKIGEQYFDDAGDPLVFGKLYFYNSGTTTAKDTYADVNLGTPNQNPVILTAAGRQPNIFFTGSARVVLTKNDETQVEVRDPEGGETEEGVFSPWNTLTIYNTPDIVVGSDGLFYLSITSGNQSNDPTTDSVNWTQIKFIRVWNANETYPLAKIVEGSDGKLYTAATGDNLGNNPISDTINWNPAADADTPNAVKSGGRTFAYNNF